MAANKILKAALILSAVDKMSRTVNKATTNAERRLTAVQKKSADLSRTSGNFARQTGALGLATAAAIAVPAKIAMDFEQSMANLGAISRATDSELLAMTKRAREMGSTTQFSASQAAEGMRFLAMAGFSVKQNIAAIPNVLNLAAAGAVDLGVAADISSNILSGFNLKVSELNRVNDVLVNTFTSSNTTLESLAETMKYAAPVAAGLKIPIETVAAMAGKLGDAGIPASMAGTALRSSMLRLASPMKKGSKALKSIGVVVKDANGNLRPMTELLAEIGKKVEGLPSARRAGIIKDVFGTEAASGATVLLRQAASGALDKYISTLSRANSTNEIAAKQMKTTKGSLLLMKSAGEELAIVVGNVLLPPLAKLMTRAASLATRIGAWAEKHPKLTRAIVVGTAAISALLLTASGVGFLFSGITSFVGVAASAFKILSIGVGYASTAFTWLSRALLTNPILLIITAIAGAAYLIYKNWAPIKAFFGNVWDGVKSSFSAIWEWVSGLGSRFFEAGKNIVMSIGKGIAKMILWPAKQIGKVVQKIRDYLPFSPAKIGPLSDLHRVKISETIAGTITPKPIESAMNRAVEPIAISPVNRGGGGGSVNYSPTVNIYGSMGAGAREDLLATLEKHKMEILRLINDAKNREARIAF